MMDFPRGWQIARSVPCEQHHPQCSFRIGEGGFLCDCEVITKHPEYLCDGLYGTDGKVIRPSRKTWTEDDAEEAKLKH